VEIPKTRYARSADGTYIAYQVFGDGPDLLLAWPWISHLEMLWEIDEANSWLRALARFARVISMDQRGIGLSDRMTQMIDLETRVDDVRAVLDAAGSDRPVLYGQGLDGGAICSMFAAMYPERTAGLLLWTGQASGIRDADYPWPRPRRRTQSSARSSPTRGGTRTSLDHSWPPQGRRHRLTTRPPGNVGLDSCDTPRAGATR
jgi:pimeloyl-ACP methyl ester carboxylesterase